MSNYFKHKMRGMHPAAIAGLIILGIVGIVGLAILFGFVIMWLWNWLMPELFGLPMVTYWQAVGLFILLKILIGGCGGSRSGGKRRDGRDRSCDGKKKSKDDFSKWKHYDRFWEEEGGPAYEKYVERLDSNVPSVELTDKKEDKEEKA